MAYWAELDDKNTVIRVTRGDNNDLAGDEGLSWLQANLGGLWMKTSFDGAIRKNFAGIGFTYDEQRDAFIPPKPYESWLLNETSCRWDAPVAYPSDGFAYAWNEDSLTWQLIDFAE